ncbi:MAG: hypothetical protein JO254_07830 [Pseudolabrys sp.]|uniref:hypothetical protein n=1 Tax=Bradyrhizobium sp. TaxID=376 RepID=UPI001EBB3BD9|nr:hypothetical protein [Bradyrhizobium sp.]MBV9556975.1 hypothetical protein [Pseudolabrys sp.]MBV9982774.1 hypothetical protein [Bradyrhizobium sp.]
MPPTAPALFINLDLVLKSQADFSAIIGYFDEKALVLSHDEHDGEWTLGLELAEHKPARDPADHTRRFLAMISEFPAAVRDAWDACTSRTFSYGFDGGANAPALDVTISAELLRQMAHVGIGIGISVYPIRQA